MLVPLGIGHIFSFEGLFIVDNFFENSFKFFKGLLIIKITNSSKLSFTSMKNTPYKCGILITCQRMTSLVDGQTLLKYGVVLYDNLL